MVPFTAAVLQPLKPPKPPRLLGHLERCPLLLSPHPALGLLQSAVRGQEHCGRVQPRAAAASLRAAVSCGQLGPMTWEVWRVLCALVNKNVNEKWEEAVARHMNFHSPVGRACESFRQIDSPWPPTVHPPGVDAYFHRAVPPVAGLASSSCLASPRSASRASLCCSAPCICGHEHCDVVRRRQHGILRDWDGNCRGQPLRKTVFPRR